MAKEYIEREAATQYFKERSKDFIGHEPVPPAFVIMGCANEVDAIPAADVRPAVRGRWKHEVDTYFGFTDVEHRCSQCGKVYSGQGFCAFHFCPNCGADMRTSEEPENLTYIPPEERSGVDDG